MLSRIFQKCNKLETSSDPSVFDASSQIRVLILEEGELLSKILASFQIVTLESRVQPHSGEKIEWEAVSYAWEGQTPSCYVQIDGKERYVSRNVYNILGELRYRTEKRLLWIDALCIKQDDNEEKELQVAMMRSIYESARTVIVWLCPKPNTAADAVVDAARWIENGIDQSKLSIKEPLLTCFRQEHSIEYCQLPFHRILALPWFRRVWVVQEAAVAKNLLVHIGGRSLPWELFTSTTLRFMSYLDAREAIEAPLAKCFAASIYDSSASPHNSGLTMLNLITNLREWLRDSRVPIPPSELVSMCRDREATVKSDMIYAVSGFFGLKEPAARAKVRFQINYEIPTDEVSMRFTVWCLQQENNLDILAQRRYENGNRGGWGDLPTWAADCTHPSGSNFNIAERSTPYARTTRPLISKRSPTFRRNGDFLILRGFVIDTFEQQPSGSLEVDEDYYRNWLQMIPNEKKANLVLFGEKTPTVQTLKRLRKRTMEKDERLSHLWRDGASVSKEARLEWHRPFITKRGCLAVTFLYCGPGVKICYLLGGRSLFVLSPQDLDHSTGKMLHTLVAGECFIDGFENGKGFEMARRMGLKEEDICLI